MSTQIYPDAESAAIACAEHTASSLRVALEARGHAAIALSGGTSPRTMFARLAELDLPWNRMHVFWVDERAVPPADPESNYRFAAESLLNHIAIPPHNVHRIRAELAPEAAAREYTQAIRTYFGLTSGEMPVFDVVHRGIGPDAHTASLFPGEPLVADRAGIAAAVYVEKKAQWRITLLPGPLEAARTTVMLVTGADKAEALRAVLGEPYDPSQLPAQIASVGDRDVAWFLDQPAARLLPTV